MRNMNRLARLVAMLAYASLQVGEMDVHGGGFTGATEWTQIANNVQLSNITMQTLQQLAEDIKQTTVAIQQAKQLDFASYSDVAGQIRAVEDVVRAGQGLAYSMSNLDSEWNIRFHEAGFVDAKNYPQVYQTWAKTSMDSIRGTMGAVVGQGQRMQSDAAMVAQLQAHAQSGVAGSLQAAQVLNEMVAALLGEQQQGTGNQRADLQSKEAFQAQQIQQGMAARDLLGPGKFFSTDTSQLGKGERQFPDEYTSTILGVDR